MNYKITRIPKGAGKYREIFIVSEEDRIRLRGFLPELYGIHDKLDTSNAAYAFQKKKNCALKAFQHIGCRYTLSLDLENFFDSVTVSHVTGLIPIHIVEQCFLEGNPKQGLPTSPLISSIAFLSVDSRIKNAINRFGIDVIYTRYADDLVFSFNHQSDNGRIKTIVKQIVEDAGFKLNYRKTKLQSVDNGRIIITGIAIDADGLHATRRIKKRMRAALHQENYISLRGLTEWSKCRLPGV